MLEQTDPGNCFLSPLSWHCIWLSKAFPIADYRFLFQVQINWEGVEFEEEKSRKFYLMQPYLAMYIEADMRTTLFLICLKVKLALLHYIHVLFSRNTLTLVQLNSCFTSSPKCLNFSVLIQLKHYWTSVKTVLLLIALSDQLSYILPLLRGRDQPPNCHSITTWPSSNAFSKSNLSSHE